MRILILGASGMLGRVLTDLGEKAGHSVIPHGNQASGEEFLKSDLTLPDAVEMLIEGQRPNVVINLVALTSVDKCEIDLDRAFRLNTEIPARVAQSVGADTKVIHISTDHVYDGDGAHKSAETESKLRNVYAVTKIAGEIPVLSCGGVVLRTNFFGPSCAPGRRSFSDSIRTALSNGDAFFGFEDVFFNPLTMSRLSSEILRVANHWHPGLYNLGASSVLSKFDFCRLVAERYGLDATRVGSRKQEEAALAAARPRGMAMDVTKYEAVYGVQLPSLQSEILNLER